MIQRVCHPCNVCCTALRIDSTPGLSTRLDNGEDIAKPAGVPCKYLTDTGCGIYEVRPGVCRRFECDFKRGLKGFNKHPLEAGYFGKDRHLFVFNYARLKG